MSFAGLKVVALESRRAVEIERLIRNRHGEAIVVPAVREAPLDDGAETLRFAERLFAGDFDMMIFLTGVGARALRAAIGERYPDARFLDTLRDLTVAVRGPKPASALREMGIEPDIVAPMPGTWRELLAATANRPERRIAVQEYGRPNTDLLDALRARGAAVTPVRVYRWELPEDTAGLRRLARELAAGAMDVLLLTTGVQVTHLFRIAAEEGVEWEVREALRTMVVASIGPSTNEVLEEAGIEPDLVPSQPKMGLLVMEAADRAVEILKRKRGR
ncbi:MAG: uroporphyrinogen-III synthase [Bryobacteraceae bacterium]